MLPTLAALTLGIGVGALGGVALSRSAIVLFLIGCFVHLWCIVRQRLAGGSSPKWIAVLNGVAWAAIVVAAGLVAFAGIGT